MPDFFQFDLSQTGWRPSSLEALAAEASRALEGPVSAEGVEFFGIPSAAAGTDGPREVLDSAEALQGFCEGSQSDEASGQVAGPAGAIRLEVPEKVAADLRKPRKLSLLSTGRQISKFNGELRNSDIEFSLKFFDCGHFRIKETLVGTSSTSAGVRGSVYEGRWEQCTAGVKMDFSLRYTWPQARRRSAAPAEGGSTTYEVVPPEVRTAQLQFVGEGEETLRGTLPTFLGEQPTGEVELHGEADVVEKQQQQSMTRRHQQDEDDDEWECNQILKQQVRQRPAPRPPPPRPKPYRDWENEEYESDEPTWPMYLGIFLFIVIFCVFAWLWYEERYSPEASKEFDEL